MPGFEGRWTSRYRLQPAQAHILLPQALATGLVLVAAPALLAAAALFLVAGRS